jgi:hypothetical protein
LTLLRSRLDKCWQICHHMPGDKKHAPNPLDESGTEGL